MEIISRAAIGIFTFATIIATPAAAQTYNWSGVYIGGGVGLMDGQVDRFYPNFQLVHLPLLTFTTRANNTIHSFHGGFQWQFGQWVLGVEGTYNRPEHRLAGVVSVSPPEPFTSLAAANQLNYLITVGPRIGYSLDRALIFATGGYATGEMHGGYVCSDTGQPVFPGTGSCGALFGSFATRNFGGTTRNGGWFAGGGVEAVIYQATFGDVLFGAEYQHFELDQKTAFCFSPGCAILSTQDHVDFQHGARGDIVRVRLSVKTNVFRGVLPGN